MFANAALYQHGQLLFPCCSDQVQIDDLKNTKTMKVALLNAPFVPNMRHILESILKVLRKHNVLKQQDRFHSLIVVEGKCTHLPSVFEILARLFNSTRCKYTPDFNVFFRFRCFTLLKLVWDRFMCRWNI